MRSYLVDVPVRVNIWIRPECQRRQFDVIKQARPSIMFLQSDGGRNDKEWEAIKENRRIFDNEIDWNCRVYKLYEDKNNGLYSMGRKVSKFIWGNVDRCIFLEDDYVPAISFFQFCAELLEKYKDDKRIGRICGNNVFGSYQSAEPFDYFFTENGWSIWGTATWKDRQIAQEFPFDYANNPYIQKCLKDNLTPFWFKKVVHYSKGELFEGHVPGGEYYNAINSALFHQLSIVPTHNMICNIGTVGEHSNIDTPPKNSVFNLPTYEIIFPIKHPKYIIDDKFFGYQYSIRLGHTTNPCKHLYRKTKQFFVYLFQGKLLSVIQRKLKHNKIEK